MISKIKDIFKFGSIINLIDINRLSNKDDYISKLKKKYEIVTTNEIDSLKDKKQIEAAEIIANFITILFIQEKSCSFLESIIGKLNKIISSLALNILMRKCLCEDIHQPIKEFIFQKYLNGLVNIDKIMSLIRSLPIEVNIKFLKELMEKCKFTVEEFYSLKNNKIKLLCELNDNGILDKKICNEAIGAIEVILNNIYKDIENGNIRIRTLELFLKNEKDIVIKRLALIKVSIENFNPFEAYGKIKRKFYNIYDDIIVLTYMKNSLSIFHRKKYIKVIKEITDIISRLENIEIKNYNDEVKEKINNFNSLKATCEMVSKVKDFILFKVIYDRTFGKDEEYRFNKGVNKLKEIKILFDERYTVEEIYERNKEIFDKIKILLNTNELKVELFIRQMIDYFNIREVDLINDWTIIFKSKKYEMDLKSIIFFFESLNPNDKKWNQILSKYCETLSGLKLRELKEKLIYLKRKGIYDYEKENYYLKVFTSLYGKREAIDFLLSKIDEDIQYLYDRIDPINQTIITKKNIQDFEECKKIFSIFKELHDNFQLFEYIKNIHNDEIIKSFESYSKNYSYIIELDINDNSWFNLFDIANEIIQNSNFIINQDKEDFCYGKNKRINMEGLIQLKNKIHMNFQKKNNDKKEPDLFQIKCEKLVFFKESISNLEMIRNNIKVLLQKGRCLPILFSIKLEYPNIKYYLNKIETNFGKIKDFLL